MSRGLGSLQRRILAALAVTPNQPPALTTRELSTLLDRSPRRIRAAIYSLETRGLVHVQKRYLGHAGVGRYGPTWGQEPAGMPTSGLLVWHPERADEWDAKELERLAGEPDEDAWEWEDDAWSWWPLP